MARLTFLGAAGCVTGSKYLVEVAGKRLLVDCGIFQSSQELQDRNYRPLPIDPKTIDYLVLTHAHLDHTGWLPVLVKSGYRGPIFANPATIELTAILLKDSAHLQEEDTLHARIHKYSRHANPEPLYTTEDVDPTLKLIKSMPRSGGFDISPEFHVASYDAGHILGSSSLELTITEGGKKTVVVFSGDIGRYDQAILKDPTTPPSKADVLICESTKGDPLNAHEFHLTRSAEESKAINKVKTPCIIISASGMVSGGRVLHHMVQRLPDARNAVILAGFQAEGTRGRALQEGAKSLNLYGQVVPVCAEIVEMGQFSAHAGKSELLRWLTALPAPPTQTYLTHGEPAAAQALQAAISQKFQWKAAVARYMDSVPVGE